MRIVNENFETIKESEVDLSKGCLITATVIKEDAEPIDDITKFAWDDDDYEEVQMYCLNREMPLEIPKDDKEERLKALELDIKEIKGLYSNLTKKLSIKEDNI